MVSPNGLVANYLKLKITQGAAQLRHAGSVPNL
jgi:hypothetical protein